MWFYENHLQCKRRKKCEFLTELWSIDIIIHISMENAFQMFYSNIGGCLVICNISIIFLTYINSFVPPSPFGFSFFFFFYFIAHLSVLLSAAVPVSLFCWSLLNYNFRSFDMFRIFLYTITGSFIFLKIMLMWIFVCITQDSNDLWKVWMFFFVELLSFKLKMLRLLSFSSSTLYISYW